MMSDDQSAPLLGQVSSDTDDKDTTISPPVPSAQEPSEQPTTLQTDDNNNHNDDNDQQHDKDDGTQCEKDSSVSSSLHAENLNGMLPVVCECECCLLQVSESCVQTAVFRLLRKKETVHGFMHSDPFMAVR